jgi:fructose-1,6-bisphosphatase II
MNDERLNRNLGLDLVRATEAAALSAGRWMGKGQPNDADQAATAAMARELNTIDMEGTIVVGEERGAGDDSGLHSGQRVGTGHGPQLDVVVDPIDGRRMLAQGRSGAVAVAAVAPRGTLWSPAPALYMEKLVVNRMAASALVPECLDAPAAWTLALVARAKQKQIRDLVVFVLDRPRHADLIADIRAAGARVMLRDDGDIAGAVLAASLHQSVDVLMGIGGAPEGVIAACAAKALGGAMLVHTSHPHLQRARHKQPDLLYDHGCHGWPVARGSPLPRRPGRNQLAHPALRDGHAPRHPGRTFDRGGVICLVCVACSASESRS